MRVFLARIRGLFRQRALDSRLDEELQFHLDLETAANRRRGMTAPEAERAARRAFGGEQQVKEIYRAQRGLPMLELLFKDLQYGLRTIRRSPGFTAIAVLSLALGIGANTAIFTLIDALMLRSLPVEKPDRLVAIGDVARPGGMSNGGPRLDLFSYPLYRQLREQNQVFSGLAASGRAGRLDVEISGGGEEPVRGRLVSGNFFAVLGVRPALGRTFRAEEDRAPGSSPVVVISYDYWQSRFARDPAILGRVLKVNGAVLTVIGVGPRGFIGEVVGSAADLWIPLSMQAQVNPGDGRLDRRDSNWLLLLGRLKPGVSLAQARTRMTALAMQAVLDPAHTLRGQTVAVQPGGRGFSSLRRRFSQPLGTLMIVVGLVLLIACANIANLLLARAATRRKEISVRLATGASRARLVRQLLTESLLLAALGGAAGLLLAWAGSGILLRLAAGGATPVPLNVQPNGTMLAFTAGVAALTGILFGLAPALRSTRIDLGPALKENARSVTAAGGRRLGKLLVAGQVALSLLLLVGAGLSVRSLVNLETLDVGYSRSHVAVLRTDPIASGYATAQQLPLTQRLIERLRSIPGVVGATVSENGIFSGTDSGTGTLRIPGFTSTREEDLSATEDRVGPGYFQVLGVPLVARREFDRRDTAGSPRVVVLNETMARFYFGSRDPVGQSMQEDDLRYTIVGVAKDMKERGLKGPAERRLYTPFLQITDGIEGFNFEIRTRGDAAQILPAVRREMHMLDGNLKVLSLEPVRVLIDRSITDEWLIAQLSGFFGVLALLLAAIGLYGVMAYSVSRRGNEIGLRMALGADRGSVVRMVLGETLALAAAGIAIGLPAAWGAARLLAASLVGVSSSDPATLGAATVAMLVVAAFAGWVPAYRAAHMDPMAALRWE
jgi:predicted permease